jgi:hypothetical protein
MREQEQYRQPPSEPRGRHAAGGASERPPPRRCPFADADQDAFAFGAPEQHQPGQRDARERHRLGHGNAQLAVLLRREDLRRHHSESPPEDVRSAERAKRGHERQECRASERRPEDGQDDADERPPVTGPKGLCRLEHRGVEPGQAGAREEVKVHVHRIRVHEQNRTGALEMPRGLPEPEYELQEPGDESRFAI